MLVILYLFVNVSGKIKADSFFFSNAKPDQWESAVKGAVVYIPTSRCQSTSGRGLRLLSYLDHKWGMLLLYSECVGTVPEYNTVNVQPTVTSV
jgi:hypothetical protein